MVLMRKGKFFLSETGEMGHFSVPLFKYLVKNIVFITCFSGKQHLFLLI